MAIGDVKLVAGMQEYSRVSVNPDQFGAGVGRALENLGRGLGDYADGRQAILDATADRAKKTEKFDAEQSYIRHVGALNRQQADRLRDSSERAAGITNATEAAITAANEEWLQTIPAHLQDEYRTRLVRYEEDSITKAFNFEYTQGVTAFTKDIDDAINEQAGMILSGEVTAEEARSNVSELIAIADIPQETKRDLADQADAFISRGEFQKNFEAARTRKGTTGAPADGSDVVAAGLMPHERAILNTIAAEESPGYNVHYGGSRFSDYARHPNKRILIKEGPNKGKYSTAAGRYQFIYSTWVSTVRDYNAANPQNPITDFSPEAQDRAALFHARKIYNRQVGAGEMTFDQVLQSGNTAAIAAMKNKLDASKGGWDAFRTMSSGNFVSLFTGEKGVAGGGTGLANVEDNIWTSQAYDGLSFEQKLQLASAASTAADQQANAAAVAAKAAQDAQREAVYVDVMAGKYRATDVGQFIDSGLITTADQIKKFQSLAEISLDVEKQAARARSDLTAGRPVSQEDDAGFYEVLGGQAGSEFLRDMDEEYTEQVFKPAVLSGQYIPDSMASILAGMATGLAGANRNYALDLLSELQSAHPNIMARSGISQEVQKEVTLATQLRPYYTEDQVQERLNLRRDPAQGQLYRQAREEAFELLDDPANDYTAERAMDAFDNKMGWGGVPDAPPTLGQRSAFMSDFRLLFSEGYAISRDADLAEDYAHTMLSRQWSQTNVGTVNKLAKYPPELYYPKALTPERMTQQLQDVFGLEGGFTVVADPQTKAEADAFQSKQSRDLPSYQVFGELSPGNWGVILDEGTGKPRRWAFEYTAEAQRMDDVSLNLENAREQLRVLRNQRGPLPGSDNDPEIQELQQRIEEYEFELNLLDFESRLANFPDETVPEAFPNGPLVPRAD